MRRECLFLLLVFSFFLAGFTGPSLGPGWKTYRYDRYHFSIESPYLLRCTDHPLTPTLGKQRIKRRMSADTFESSRFFRVTVDCSEYKSYKPSLEWIKAYVEGEARKQANEPEIITIVCSGLPAIVVKSGNGLVHRETLVVVEGRFFWTLKVEFAENDPGKAKEMADRVLQSLKIQLDRKPLFGPREV